MPAVPKGMRLGRLSPRAVQDESRRRTLGHYSVPRKTGLRVLRAPTWPTSLPWPDVVFPVGRVAVAHSIFLILTFASTSVSPFSTPASLTFPFTPFPALFCRLP